MSTVLAENPGYLAPEEYLAVERQAATRSEYFNGRIYAMAGASRQHNQITFNIAGGLHAQLRGRPCVAYVNDMRLKVGETGLYTYPDVMALCGEPRFEDNEADTLTNPAVIIEVLSDSTERYDRGDKFAHYRRLASLHDYVLVSQHRPRVEHYTRRGEGWMLREIDGLDEVLRLPEIGCELPMADIYDKLTFGVTAMLPADHPA